MIASILNVLACEQTSASAWCLQVASINFTAAAPSSYRFSGFDPKLQPRPRIEQIRGGRRHILYTSNQYSYYGSQCKTREPPLNGSGCNVSSVKTVKMP